MLPDSDDLEGPTFVPSPELESWLIHTFIADDATLFNEDHAHLQQANIGVLWTSIKNVRQGRRVVGQAEVGKPTAMGRWAKARAELQVEEWFGDIPDFILTFDAEYAEAASDAAFCALAEHELYHAAQARDEYGAPKFNRQTGLPAFTIRGHDVEEFIGVVRRYGADAAGVRELVAAAALGPTVSEADIRTCCGTCG